MATANPLIQTLLTVVSQRYKVMQPKQVLEFYRDLPEYASYELGIGPQRYEHVLKSKDEVRGYLLLATSFDGALATVAIPTSVRVVCNNTLSMAVSGAYQMVRVPHNTELNPQRVKQQLGISVLQWDNFMSA